MKKLISLVICSLVICSFAVSVLASTVSFTDNNNNSYKISENFTGTSQYGYAETNSGGCTLVVKVGTRGGSGELLSSSSKTRTTTNYNLSVTESLSCSSSNGLAVSGCYDIAVKRNGSTIVNKYLNNSGL